MRAKKHLGIKYKPDVHKKNWRDALLGETSVLHVPPSLGATEIQVGAHLHCTVDAEEKHQRSKPVGTQRIQSHFCHCIEICLYVSSLLNISSFLLVYIWTSSVQSALHQTLIYWCRVRNVSSRGV